LIFGESGSKGCLQGEGGLTGSTLRVTIDPIDRLKATNQIKEDKMESEGVKVGIKAPDFCLPDQEEKSVCLRDYKGRWVVLYFYPKDDTPGCTTEACDFTNSLAAFEKLDAAVLGISPDSSQSHAHFSEKHHLKLTLLSDPERIILETYGAWGPKNSYGQETPGVLRKTFLIDPEGRIRHIWPKVSVEGHAGEVMEKLALVRGNAK
jgi:peroxiredoxin Q/BCP